MTIAWLDAQIERELEKGNRPEAVRDLADLVTAREYLAGQYKHAEHHKLDDVHATHTHKHLDKETILSWVEGMVDKDGVHGGHFSWHQAQQHAINKGITDENRMLEMYAIMNAMYADYHHVARKFGVDREDFYACMAKAFLEDADAVQDKVEQYYRHVVKH